MVAVNMGDRKSDPFPARMEHIGGSTGQQRHRLIGLYISIITLLNLNRAMSLAVPPHLCFGHMRGGAFYYSFCQCSFVVSNNSFVKLLRLDIHKLSQFKLRKILARRFDSIPFKQHSAPWRGPGLLSNILLYSIQYCN